MEQNGHGSMGDQSQAIVSNLDRLRSRIARASIDSGRSGDSVRLVCVSKGQEVSALRAALVAGERIFGENRVQEAARKWPDLKTEFAPVELHLIGPLQTNKVREAVALFDVIETLDRPRLAEALAREFDAAGRRPKLYVEVNTGREPQKAGVLPEDADNFIKFCRQDCSLEIEGLMCIPPADQQASPHFALLAQIASRNGIDCLSMGMSADYELGIQLGATHVRVGSAIFGARLHA
ncbi:MAG: Pyridoxal phosphate homeostasis protein [Hyphomicrobiales bacterium]|nr:Pyridoxal phosphate homeostasis protein [Hyphomicrobiales bacterium]